ncbi:LOW QUALITY PROTEIN: putative zinc finger protein [Schistosoma mansoni]|uniref:putative zinc finger protein n=1 Tax=Schistosoma mansoni TaxID=6183 RepID=UPI00022DC12E|nr:LOW QUALITY PROTEIN: putative zinc finger protein [Schistosoma mansoni]|eukprot:XP_018647817.1 LOW QUALITY PROTEIN: putative zinc finger protein [Schistosoma mansoni]
MSTDTWISSHCELNHLANMSPSSSTSSPSLLNANFMQQFSNSNFSFNNHHYCFVKLSFNNYINNTSITILFTNTNYKVRHSINDKRCFKINKCFMKSKSYSGNPIISKYSNTKSVDRTLIINGPNSYACKLCSKVYSQASALKMHVRTHTLPCRCTHCGKSFSRKWLLKGHERTHTGERPYSCNVCSRSFADRSNLRAHMQTHQREKRYSCPHCPRSFSRMGLLNKHMIQCTQNTESNNNVLLKMNSGSVTESDLISALQAIGVSYKSDEINRSDSRSNLNNTSIETTLSLSTNSFPVFERPDSLRIIHNLVEGLLRVQTRDSSIALRHLNVVLSSLFKFLNDSNSDVRIAADEGLNKLIKFLRSSMTRLILFELLMELKRNQNSRSVSVALSKFASLSTQIRTSKRRFYATNLLPVLISIFEQEDDLLFENLTDSFRQIAKELFYYATEKELLTFLRAQITRLSSSKAVVRRSVAQSLVITCQSSRVPLTLLRYLLHLILTEMDSLTRDSQSEPTKVECDKSSTPFNSTAYWTGLFNTIRYLSIGWDQFSNNFMKNISFLNLNIPPTSSVHLDSHNTLHSRLIDLESHEMLNPGELSTNATNSKETPDFAASNRFLRTLSSESIDGKSPTSDFQSVDSRDTYLIRSASSSSLSSIKIDLNDSAINGQEIQNQLSAVRAHLARDGEKSMDDDNDDIFSYLGYNIVGDSSRNVESAQSDSHDSINPDDHIHDQQPSSIHYSKFRPFNLVDLINCLNNQGEPINLVQADWLLPFLLLSFDMMPQAQETSKIHHQWPRPLTSPRISLQLLVINCLTQLAQLNPLMFFVQLNGDQCCPNDQLSVKQIQWPTAVEVILEFLSNSTDPQAQGQLCILIGNLIASYLVWQDLTDQDPDYGHKFAIYTSLDHLFTKLDSYLNTNVSGITLRWALSGLRACSNALLSCADRKASFYPKESHISPDELLVYRFLKTLSSIVIHASRHPYRLVRRELLTLVTELDWASVGYLEGTLKTHELAKSALFSVMPVRLIDLTRTECWRILCDTDPDLREHASTALIALASNLTSSIGDNLGISTGGLLPNRIKRSLYFWLPQPCSKIKSKVSCYGLVGALGVHGLPPCLSTLPMEMDVGPIGRQFYQSQMSQLLYLEAEHNEISNQVTDFYLSSTGTACLFRKCLTALMELPCSSFLPEDRYMLLGVVSCLNQLIGSSHLLSYSHLWFDPSPSSSAASESTLSNENPVKPIHRRSRLSLLSWHCLTLLSSAPVTSLDLELQSSLLNLCTGCVTRWSVYTLLDRSSKDKSSNELPTSNKQQPFTRYALAFMQHLMRVCCILWHIFEAIHLPQHHQSDSITSKIPISSVYFGISESFMHSVANLAQTRTHFSTTQFDHEIINSPAGTANNTPMGNSGTISSVDTPSSKKRNYGTKLGGSLRKHLPAPRHSPTLTSSTLGYFANLPQYMSLYKTLKTAYKSFKISADLTGSHDRLMGLLQTCLYSFGRLLENLHFDEIAPYADELLVYLTSFYNWQPGPCLELSTQLLRAFVGTNLCNQWDDQLCQLYSDALNSSVSDQDMKSDSEEKKNSKINLENTLDFHIRKLLHQNKVFTNYLWDQNVLKESKACCWITSLELIQSPISAWIRFARQRRIPVGLKYASSTDRVSPTIPNQTMIMSALKIKFDTQLFFKRLEHIVLCGMENYKWTNCYSLQTNILDLLIYLIYLRMNYCQLDVQQYRVISSSLTSVPSASTLAQSKHLDSGNSENSSNSPASTTSNATNDKDESIDSRLVELSQVVHLAEALAAETCDPGSIVLTAMIPVIVDLFVIQQPLNQRINKQTENVDQAKMNQIQQANAQRETIFSLLLRRLSHLPASYDQISLILEEVNISTKICKSENVICIIDCLTQVSNHILSHLATGTAQIDNPAEFDALQRLLNHLVVIINSLDETESSQVVWTIISKVEEVLYNEFHSKILLDNYNILHFIRWTVTQVFCGRFLFHLFNCSRKLLQPINFDISKRITKLFEHSLLAFQQIIDGIKFFLLYQPMMIGQITSLEFDYLLKSTNLILLIQLSLNHLLNLIELVKSDFWINIDWNIKQITSLFQVIHKTIYSLGKYEPLLCFLWYQLIYSKELNIMNILLRNCHTKSFPDDSDDISSNIFLPNFYIDSNWTSINLELVHQFIMVSYIQSQLSSNNIDIVLQNLLSPVSDGHVNYSHRKKIIRLLNMWHSGEPIVCDLMSQLSNSKSSFKQIHDGFMENLSLMSLEQIHFILNNMFNKVHTESTTYQLDTLFNIFITPQCKLVKFEKEKHCSTCARSIMPISLRTIASIKACNILEWILKTCDNKAEKLQCIVPYHVLVNYRTRLTTQTNNFKSDRLLNFLDEIIKFTNEKPNQTEKYIFPGSLTHVNFNTIIKQPNQTTWLLNSAKDLLMQYDLSAALNGIRLIHALSECTNIKEKKISNILNSVCLRCSPRILYYALVLGSSSASSSLSLNSLSTIPEITNQTHKPCPKTSNITPCVNVLFRVAQKILFQNIQNIVTNPSELFTEVEDPNLADSVQTYLTGLSFALLEFLRVLPHLPLGDLVPIEKETDALSFLLILIEFFFHSMGYPYSKIASVCSGNTYSNTDHVLNQSQIMNMDNNNNNNNSNNNKPPRYYIVSVTMMQTSLRLLNYILQTALNRSAKGVDLFGGDGKKILSIFLVFIWMIDKSACLSEYTTIWSKSTNQHMINAVQRILDEYAQQSITKSSSLLPPELSTTILLNNLLTPLYPPIMGLWWPDSISASTLSHFCAATASVASFSILNSTTNQARLGNIEGGFIQPCQLIGKCRLLRSNFIQSTGLDIVGQLNICTLGISRLLHTLNVSSSYSYSSINMSFHESNDAKASECINSFVNLDLDHLIVNITRLNAMGWLDRREFERIWTNYLELLSSASDAQQNIYSVKIESDNGQLTSSEESIECNQSIVIGLRGLTRLLMDTSLKPQPGDTLYSRLHHHSRLGIPHFSHTKLGRKLISLLTMIEREQDYINNSNEYSLICTTYSEHMNRLNETGDLELINLERLTNWYLDGPSQFAVDRLIRRLRMRENPNPTVWSSVVEHPSESEKLQLATPQSVTPLQISKSNHRPTSILTLQNYEDPLFSCLQSLQLFYHSCLKPEPFTIRSDNEDINTLLLGTSKLVDLFTSNSTISSSLLNKNSSKQIKQQTSTVKGPAFDVWQSILQSAIILSDLFTTQEQFIWLNDHLQDALKQLPTWDEFQSPIHIWLALGISKCTAVLELVNSSPTNSHVLQPYSLEPAVKQTMNAINSSLLTVQNAGLHSAMYLLHTALLIRRQPYQQQLQQHSPPTGSSLLNELYTFLCSYLEKKINTIFCNSITTNLLGTETLINQNLSVSSTGSSGMKRFMQAVLHPGTASKITNTSSVERESSIIQLSNIDLTDHIEQHQLMILSTAFFLTEHFSGPPVFPIVTDSGIGITEMLSGLTAILFRLASCMLSDVPIMNQSKYTNNAKCSALNTGTTVELSYSFPVHLAWCQGIERLIHTGRLGKGAIGSLQKMCINRIRTCRSPHISFLAIRLLLTCMYTSLGRLNDRIQHYRRIHHTQQSDSTSTNCEISVNNKINQVAMSYEDTPGQCSTKPGSKVSDDSPFESLPSSILQDSENIVAITQESINCLWERIRGGISLINSPVQPTHGLHIAWTSVTEARLITRLLPFISSDVTQTFMCLISTPESMNKQSNLTSSILDCNSLPNSVLNKALGEFARADHSFPNLAASNLTQLFESFMQSEKGQNLVRQWVLLSFPTLLSRQPSYLAIWACTVCLLAAATEPKLRTALFLCYTYKLSNTEPNNSFNISTDTATTTNTDSNNSPSSSSSSFFITSSTNLWLNDLLCLAAYHFVTDGLLKPILKSESEILYNKRQAERDHFLALIKDHCDKLNTTNNNSTVTTPTTTNATNNINSSSG